MTVLTLPTAKTHLNIPASNTSSDGELVSFIAAAEQSIVDRCGPLEPATVTERVDGYRRWLRVHTTPVLSITSVTPVGGTALSLPDLDTDLAAGLIGLAGGSSFWSRRYDVVYQAGRAAVDADLLFAVKEQLRYLWQTQLGNSPSSGAAPGQPSGAESVAGLPSLIDRLIRPYLQAGI